MRGINAKSIINLYKKGYKINTLEALNSANKTMMQANMNDIKNLNNLPGFIGGSDSHSTYSLGLGHTIFDCDPKELEDSISVYEKIQKRIYFNRVDGCASNSRDFGNYSCS